MTRPNGAGEPRETPSCVSVTSSQAERTGIERHKTPARRRLGEGGSDPAEGDRGAKFPGKGTDGLLLLMTVIWGTNFPIVKTAFRELEPQAFNGLRLVVASVAFLTVLGAVRAVVRRTDRPPPRSGLIEVFYTPARITGREWLLLAGLGVVGHALYQFFFIGGLARTSVANGSLVLALTPMVIAFVSAQLGHDRVSLLHWSGLGFSLLGIYLVVAQGFELDRTSLTGDLMMFGAVCCWAAYTIGSRPLMSRHSPVAVSGLSMALGTAIYLPILWPTLREVNWVNVSAWTTVLVVYSALLALCVAYTIWYIGVRQIGSARASSYSNFIPIVAMLSAAIFLDEPMGLRKILGAAAVLVGVALTRSGR